jgi:hypothetical protein
MSKEGELTRIVFVEHSTHPKRLCEISFFLGTTYHFLIRVSFVGWMDLYVVIESCYRLFLFGLKLLKD